MFSSRVYGDVASKWKASHPHVRLSGSGARAHCGAPVSPARMADVSSAIAAAVALAMGGDRGLLGSSNPTRKTSSSTSAAQPCSLPPETTLQAATAAAASKLTQGQDNSGLGRFYVIRATEDQPAPAAGHFVKVVSGPHNGYDAAVASVKDPRSHEGNGNDLGGNGSSGATLSCTQFQSHGTCEDRVLRFNSTKIQQLQSLICRVVSRSKRFWYATERLE